MLNVWFLVGFILFGAIGFFAFEIIKKLDFLGNGVKFGIIGFFLLLIVGALLGGNTILSLVSGTISGFTIFFGKSAYAIYTIYMTETRATMETLVVHELEPHGELNHYGIEGIGSNFELFNYLVEAISEGSSVLYYARHIPEETPLYKYTWETLVFYANQISPLPKVRIKDRSNVIKQIAIEASYLDTMERGLFNYWVRAYLSGGYVSVLVPFMDDFLDKAAVCEQSFGGELEIDAIMGDSSYLVLTNSLSAKPSVIDVYTRWTADELISKIETVHPITHSEPDNSL